VSLGVRHVPFKQIIGPYCTMQDGEAELQTYLDTLYELIAGTLPERCRHQTRSSRHA
jgi:hypothetical protein